MIDINKVVVENFQDNIAYIEKEHPKTFTKLAALDSAIENNHYQERYELIYENNYFDVLEKLTNKLLYAHDSHNYSEQVTDSINYNPRKDTFACFEKITISQQKKDKIKKDKLFNNYLSKYVDILYYTQNHSLKDRELKSLNKFIFFGVGLGVHIETVHKKISSKAYLIIEDNLELFRLSLFVTNYKKIADTSKLFFSIFDNNDEFSEVAKSFLNTEYYYNNYIKYFIMLNHSDEKRKIFHTEVVSQPHLTYSYNTILTQSLKPLGYIFSKYKFLNNKLSFSNKTFDKLPFLLLAAGPSLQEHKEWLRKHHHNFIIVAISAVLPFLEKEHISPNIIIHLEGASHASKLFENIQSFDFIKKSICFFSARTPTDVINLFSKKQMFLFENNTRYKEESLKLISPCVGSIAHQLLLLLQVKNIYLLGLDLAVNESGHTHIDGHTRAKILSTDSKKNIKDYKRDLVKIDGNLTKDVYTTLQYKSSIDTIGYSSKLFQIDRQNIYNISNGAKLKGALPIHAKDIKYTKINSKIQDSIFNQCIKTSTKGLDAKEIELLHEKIMIAYDIKKLIKTIQNTKNTTAVKFLDDLKELSLYISDTHTLKHELVSTIDNYLKYLLSIIFNYFNYNNLINEKTDIGYIKNILCENILDILNYYISNLEIFIKKK